MVGEGSTHPPRQRKRRRKDSTMNKNFTMTWKENGTEKIISFDFSYDYAKHVLKADVSLRGDSEAPCYNFGQ